ncbi:MAG: nucleoside hydrolase [Chloroflexota bacterium]|nr:nucleoside hydrolase [Chloroflexota bacterium]
MKLIIDCDTGIDDAVALAYALASSDADILGIGTVHGNVESNLAAENTLKLLKVAGRTDIPVAVGAATPILRPLLTAKWVHGEDGLGNSNLPPSGLQPTGEHASDQIIRLAREHPGQVTLVPIGPLTNLALALLKEPELPGLIREVVLMGGAAAEPGNVTAVAEANIWHDPHAASLVFSASWPVSMVGLDVTMRTMLLETHLERWRAAGTPVTEWLLKVVPFYFEFYSASLGRRACAMHDAVAVGLALGQVEVLKAHVLPVSVATEEGPAFGQTVVDRRPVEGKLYSAEGRAWLRSQLSEQYHELVTDAFTVPETRAKVLMQINGESFVDALVDRVATLGAH